MKLSYILGVVHLFVPAPHARVGKAHDAAPAYIAHSRLCIGLAQMLSSLPAQKRQKLACRPVHLDGVVHACVQLSVVCARILLRSDNIRTTHVTYTHVNGMDQN